MDNTNETIKAKFQKLEDERELEKISGGKCVYGVYLDDKFARDNLVSYLENPQGYNLDEGKFILIDEEKDETHGANYKVIGSYDSKEEIETAANALKSNDSTLKYLKLGIFGEYGMLELIALHSDKLHPRHHW